MNKVSTILEQLGGHRRLSVMVGAKDFCGTDDRMLSFRIGKGAKRRINAVQIELTPDDLYEVRFLRIWGGKVTIMETFEGVYADSLVSLFESRTGFYLSL